MYKSTITSKGQTTIPIEIRKLLGVGEGDQLQYTQTKKGSIEITPRKRYTWRDLRDVLPKPKKALSDKEIKQSIAEFWGRKGAKK